jgi:Cu/Ag efflux protein CusF
MKRILTACLAAFAADSPAVVVADSYSAEAVVTAVDYTARTATLKTADGMVSTIPVGAEVKNFGQLKVGDKVQAKYSTALSVRLVKKGSGAAYKRETTDTASRDAGNKPGAAAMRQVNFAADITKLDPVTGDVTVKGPAGRIVNLKVKDTSVLKGYVVGDQVEGTFLEVLAIGVPTPAPAMKAPAAAPAAK